MDYETAAPTESIVQIKYLVGIVTSSLSLAFILSLFAMYFLRPYSKSNVFFRMVVHMEFPNAIYAATGLFIFPESFGSNFCVISGAVRQFTNLSSYCWTLAIAYHIYSSISVHEIRPFSFSYILFGYGLPIPFTLGPWFYDMYRLTPIYCGLPYKNPLPNLVVYYIPVFTILVGTCYCYYSVIRYLRTKVSKEAAQEFYALLLYPLLVVLYNVGAFTFLLEAVYGKDKTISAEVLAVVSTGVLQAQGIFDVLVYAQNYAIREDIKSKLCGKRQNDLHSEFDPSYSMHLGLMEISKRRFSTTAIEDSTIIHHARYFSFREDDLTRSSITV